LISKFFLTHPNECGSIYAIYQIILNYTLLIFTFTFYFSLAYDYLKKGDHLLLGAEYNNSLLTFNKAEQFSTHVTEKKEIMNRSNKVTVRKGRKSPSVSEANSFLLEVIFGLMLGDLSAERSQLNGDTRLRFYYSIVNKLYIEYLYDLFKIYVKTGPRELERKHNKLMNKIHTVIYFSTLKFAFFNWVFEDFYVKLNCKNVKIIPKNAYQRLTPVSLAFWIMDDGSFNKIKGYVILCTDSYTKEDVVQLLFILSDKFKLSCALVELNKNNKTVYRIRINKSSVPYLICLIRPYMIPSMYYKLGL